MTSSEVRSILRAFARYCSAACMGTHSGGAGGYLQSPSPPLAPDTLHPEPEVEGIVTCSRSLAPLSLTPSTLNPQLVSRPPPPSLSLSLSVYALDFTSSDVSSILKAFARYCSPLGPP